MAAALNSFISDLLTAVSQKRTIYISYIDHESINLPLLQGITFRN